MEPTLPTPERTAPAAGGAWSRAARAVVLLALLLRLGLLAKLGPILYEDSGLYLIVGKNLALHGCFCDGDGVKVALYPFALRMPLFPALVAMLARLFGTGNYWPPAALGITFSVATVAMTIWLGTRLGGPRVGLAAGLLMALSPASVEYSPALMADTLFAFWMTAACVAGLLCAGRPKGTTAARWGAFLALGAMTKPILKYYWMVAGPFLLWHARPLRRGATLALVACAIPTLALGAWMTRNWLELQFAGLDALTGANLLWSNMDLVKPATGEQRRDDPFLSSVRDVASRYDNSLEASDALRARFALSPVAVDRVLTRLGVQVVLENPRRYLAHCCINWMNYLTTAASSRYLLTQLGLAGPDMSRPLAELVREHRFAPAAGNLVLRLPWLVISFVLCPLGAFGFWKDPEKRAETVLLIGTILYHAGLCGLVAANDRYRLAIEPLMFTLVARALVGRPGPEPPEAIPMN